MGRRGVPPRLRMESVTGVRKGRASILAGEDIQIVAEAATGTEGISKTKKYKPDVLRIDVLMPEQPRAESDFATSAGSPDHIGEQNQRQ